jgi:hypothetical protein
MWSLAQLSANAALNRERPLVAGDRVVDLVDCDGEGTVVGPDPNSAYKGSVVVRFDETGQEVRKLAFSLLRLEPTEHSPSE